MWACRGGARHRRAPRRPVLPNIALQRPEARVARDPAAERAGSAANVIHTRMIRQDSVLQRAEQVID